MERPATVEYEDDLLLTCTASGGPNNMFYWFKDGVYLNGSTDAILNITDVTADDGGLYECVVNNTAGNSSADITIYSESSITYVNISLCILQLFCLVTPRFITVPQSVEAFIGTAVNLSCSADGFPVPDITWLFQGMPYTNETVNNTDSTSAESTIVITDLMLSHGGTYTCVIDSDAIIMSLSNVAAVVVISGKYIHRDIILPLIVTYM